MPKYVVCVQRLSKRHWVDLQCIAADAAQCHDQGTKPEMEVQETDTGPSLC